MASKGNLSPIFLWIKKLFQLIKYVSLIIIAYISLNSNSVILEYFLIFSKKLAAPLNERLF